MVRLRIEGERAEVEQAAACLARLGIAETRSRWCANRRTGSGGRIYLDMDGERLRSLAGKEKNE